MFVAIFTLVVLALVVIILFAKWAFVPSGDVDLEINESKHLKVPAGGKLLGALAADLTVDLRLLATEVESGIATPATGAGRDVDAEIAAWREAKTRLGG